jgi:hypothetical protein
MSDVTSTRKITVTIAPSHRSPVGRGGFERFAARSRGVLVSPGIVTGVTVAAWIKDAKAVGHRRAAADPWLIMVVASGMVREPLLCPHCGDEVDQRDLHVQFTLPDPVLGLPQADQATYVGGDIISVPHVGAFARVLLPIRMTGGYRLTIATWLGFTNRSTYDRAVQLWNTPDYRMLRIDGKLANQVWPWRRVLGLRVQAAVAEERQVPYVAEIRSLRLRKLLSTTWQREDVMAAFPDELWHRSAATTSGE